MEAIKLSSLDTTIMFIEARLNLSRLVVTGCAAKTSATVTFPSLNLNTIYAKTFNISINGVASKPSWVRCIKQSLERLEILTIIIPN